MPSVRSNDPMPNPSEKAPVVPPARARGAVGGWHYWLRQNRAMLIIAGVALTAVGVAFIEMAQAVPEE